MRTATPNRVWTLWKNGRPLELTEQLAPDGHILMLRDGDEVLRRDTFTDYQSSVVADAWRTSFERAGWIRLFDGPPVGGARTLATC